MRPGAQTDLDKQRALEAALAGQINWAFGKGSVMKLGVQGKIVEDTESVSTGLLGLDIALGIGGAGRRDASLEIYGPESSGKTTLALHVVAEVQKAGGTAAFIDAAEHALDLSYAHTSKA